MGKITSLIHEFFVPSERNGYRSRSVHHGFLTTYLIIAFIIVLLAKSNGGQNVLGYATDIRSAKLLELTNAQRIKNDLTPLTYNTKLQDAAYAKAKDMFANNYWAHYGPGGKTPWDFILTSEYDYDFAGENLAKNFLFSKNVVDAWMNSSSHRENMLRSDFNEVGFAIVNGVLNGEPTTLVVQMLAKPSVTELAKLDHGTEKQVPVPVKNIAEVYGEQQSNQIQPAINIRLPLTSIYLFLGFLAIVFALDYYFGAKLNLPRVHGKHIAHLMFLSAIAVGVVFFLSKGTIL